MSTDEAQAVPPWYRQFWPWVLIGLPGTVVIASFVTLGIALKHPDSVVKDDYHREGFTVNRDLAAQRLATALGVHATLRADTATGDISVKLEGKFSRQPNQLKLLFVHPNAEKFDFPVLLYPAGNGLYLGEFDQTPSGRWHLQLGAGDEQAQGWLLKKAVRINNNTLTTILSSK